MSSNELLVSIIIPVYNGEKYIMKCLDSINNQSYTAIEIVIVDDGSTDQSIELINSYAKKVGTHIIIIRQQNQGQGEARNTGINKVSGEYLMFVDQDDTLESEIVTKLISKAVRTGADIVSSGYRRVTVGGKIKEEVHLKCTKWSKYKIITPWAKIFRTEFIIKNQINFLPVALGEDIFFMMKAYSYNPKIDFLQDIGYNWLNNITSVSNTEHKKIKEKTSLLQLFNMLEQLELKENLKKDKMYEYFLIKIAIWDILYTLRDNDYTVVLKNSKEIWNWFDEHFSDYMKNSYIKVTKPDGESFSIRFIVWGYMTLKRIGLEQVLLKIFSKKRKG